MPSVAGDLPALAEIENLIETGRHDEAATALGRARTGLVGGPGAADRRDVGPRPDRPERRRPGYLVINPLNVPRRAAVILPDAALDLRPEGPLRAAQFTDEGVWAVVDLPAFGFAWVPKETDLGRPPAASRRRCRPAAASSRTSRSRSRSTRPPAAFAVWPAVGESTARLGQQLVMTGLVDAAGQARRLRRCGATDSTSITAVPRSCRRPSTGSLIDPHQGNRLASFVQRYRLWTGRPILEIEVTLSDLDPAWLEQAAQADPWSVYLACRWAWPDPNSMLRRTVFWSPELTEAERPETPDAIDISTRTQRTALLFGGLPYHRKHGSRMLDTLLVAGTESTRSFTLGVVLDLEHPFHAAQDLITPAVVVPIDDGPPSIGASGWLAQVDHKGVVVSHVEFVERDQRRPRLGPGFPPARNDRPARPVPPASVSQPDVGAPGRFPGRDRSSTSRSTATPCRST